LHLDQFRIVEECPLINQTINALLALKPHTPTELQDAPLAGSPTGRTMELTEVPMSSILSRGQTFFERVYGKISKRVMGQMDRCGTEDLGLVARLTYGFLLSNTSVLTAKESSLVMIAGLIPLDVSCFLTEKDVEGSCQADNTI
jgi:hypothetical protein